MATELIPKKAINDLNLKVETESELMAFCDFFKNVAVSYTHLTLPTSDLV